MSATGAGERSEAGAARGRGCGTRPSRQGGRRRAAPRREATGLGGAQGRGDGREVTGPDGGVPCGKTLDLSTRFAQQLDTLSTVTASARLCALRPRAQPKRGAECERRTRTRSACPFASCRAAHACSPL